MGSQNISEARLEKKQKHNYNQHFIQFPFKIVTPYRTAQLL